MRKKIALRGTGLWKQPIYDQLARVSIMEGILAIPPGSFHQSISRMRRYFELSKENFEPKKRDHYFNPDPEWYQKDTGLWREVLNPYLPSLVNLRVSSPDDFTQAVLNGISPSTGRKVLPIMYQAGYHLEPFRKVFLLGKVIRGQDKELRPLPLNTLITHLKNFVGNRVLALVRHQESEDKYKNPSVPLPFDSDKNKIKKHSTGKVLILLGEWNEKAAKYLVDLYFDYEFTKSDKAKGTAKELLMLLAEGKDLRETLQLIKRERGGSKVSSDYAQEFDQAFLSALKMDFPKNKFQIAVQRISEVFRDRSKSEYQKYAKIIKKPRL